MRRALAQSVRGTWLTELAGCSLRDIGVVVAGLAGAAFKLSTACETGEPSYGTISRILHYKDSIA
jgi:hypothetical protein